MIGDGKQCTPDYVNPSTNLLADICVLVIEDSPDELGLIARFLGDAGARVLMAVDGYEGLRLARMMRPDVILLDVMLPPPNGFEVCRALKDLTECAITPILFLSGLVDVHAKLLGFSAGGCDYITKPFSKTELVARVSLHAMLGRQLKTHYVDTSIPSWFAKALQMFQSRLGESSVLEDVVKEADITVHRFHEAFRIYLHTTPVAYLREARLQDASRKLRETATSIAAISEGLGYGSPSNFATAFRERFGVSPRQFRQGVSRQT